METSTTYPWYPNVLVLGSAGIKGVLMLGVLKAFNETKYLQKIDTIVGVSVGSMIGLLHIAGYDPKDTFNTVAKTDFMKCLSTSSLTGIYEKRGIFDHSIIETTMKELIKNKYGFIPTLGQLFMFTGINLVMTAYNIDKDITEYFSAKTHSTLSCVEACILSSNLPIIFIDRVYQDCKYIDGALGNPYPVDYCDNGTNNILGLYVHSNTTTTQDDILSYTERIIHVTINELRKHIIKHTSEKCYHLPLVGEPSDPLGISLVLSQNFNQLDNYFLKGYVRGCNFLKRLEDGQDVSIDYWNSVNDIIVPALSLHESIVEDDLPEIPLFYDQYITAVKCNNDSHTPITNFVNRVSQQYQTFPLPTFLPELPPTLIARSQHSQSNI